MKQNKRATHPTRSKYKAVAAAIAVTCLASTSYADNIGVSGAAAGSNASNANSQLERCSTPFGTLTLQEDTSSRWYRRMQSNKLTSTIPVLRLLVQQSNCFVVVERGASFDNMKQERRLMESGELRGGSNFGKGQMVAADYTMNPTISFSEKDTGGFGAAIGGLLGGDVGATIGGGISFSDSSTVLTLIDNRSGVQVAASQGNASGTNFSLGGVVKGGAAGGFGKTPEGKLLARSFADSFNNMVRALRNYKTQQTNGNMGTGGSLQIGQ